MYLTLPYRETYCTIVYKFCLIHRTVNSIYSTNSCLSRALVSATLFITVIVIRHEDFLLCSHLKKEKRKKEKFFLFWQAERLSSRHTAFLLAVFDMENELNNHQRPSLWDLSYIKKTVQNHSSSRECNSACDRDTTMIKASSEWRSCQLSTKKK